MQKSTEQRSSTTAGSRGWMWNLGRCVRSAAPVCSCLCFIRPSPFGSDGPTRARRYVMVLKSSCWSRANDGRSTAVDVPPDRDRANHALLLAKVVAIIASKTRSEVSVDHSCTQGHADSRTMKETTFPRLTHAGLGSDLTTRHAYFAAC